MNIEMAFFVSCS